MADKKPPANPLTDGRKRPGTVSHPEPSDAGAHSQHKEAFAALLALAAKSLNKID